MLTKNIELIKTLDFGSYVLPNMYLYYAEAAAICFEENDFNGNVSLKIEGVQTAQFHIKWTPVSRQIKDMHNDLVYEKMSNINQIHDQAMTIAEKAFLAQQAGDKVAFVQLSKEAFLLERKAAMMLKDKMDVEPSRSVLFKSAAFLAFDAQDYQACRDMITYTLLGKPDPIIKMEMKNLFLEVNTLLQKMPSKFEEIKSKIARLEGGSEIIREIERRFAY